jgi:zinc-binding alcohol dehydrogenase family protein
VIVGDAGGVDLGDVRFRPVLDRADDRQEGPAEGVSWSWSADSVPTSSSLAPKAWAERFAASCPPVCTARWTPGSLACRPWTPSGAFVAVAAGAAPVPLRGTRVHNVWIHTDGPRLVELAALVDAGQLTPRVAVTLPLEQVAAAHQRVAAGGLRGRIVLTLDDGDLGPR